MNLLQLSLKKQLQYKSTGHICSIFIVAIFLQACIQEKDQPKTQTANIASAKSDSWWQQRHNKILRDDKSNIQLIFLGDSIVHYWEKEGYGKPIWQRHYGVGFAYNMGFKNDRTENLLWRINNGELHGTSPKAVVLLIGTNNAKKNSAEDIAKGINSIIDSIIKKLPDTIVIVHRIFPRGKVNNPLRKITDEASEIVAKRADNNTVIYLDINRHFEDSYGNVPKDIMADGLHPTTGGYVLWANALADILNKYNVKRP